MFVLILVVVVIIALVFGTTSLPKVLFNVTIRLTSTSRDTSVGKVTPIPDDHLIHDTLKDKHALVIGGTRGIGRGIALTLAKCGASSVTVVGRDTHTIIQQLNEVAVTVSSTSNNNNQKFYAHSVDLSTVGGAGQTLVEQLLMQQQQDGQGQCQRPLSPSFDYVFFTVGCWPNYNVPFTSDGVERVVALDLLSHHVILTALVDHGMLKAGKSRIMNTIASTQNFPFQSTSNVRRRLTESTDTIKGGPGMLPFTLFPIAIAGDAWLREASQRFPDLKFVGMFPGVVSTDLLRSSFPKWSIPILKAIMSPISISEEQSGLAHVTVLTSQNVGRQQKQRKACFFNHLLEGREAHPVALDDDLSRWVFDWLDSTASMLYTKRNP